MKSKYPRYWPAKPVEQWAQHGEQYWRDHAEYHKWRQIYYDVGNVLAFIAPFVGAALMAYGLYGLAGL